MAHKIEVTKLAVDEREVNVFVDHTELLLHKQIQPEGRMLADSDHIAFVYILDVDDDFIYVSFPEAVWKNLNKVLSDSLPIFLNVNEEIRVPLIQFQEELQYFISNIEENSNYGESMVQAVSKAFTFTR
ncbi:hypothetical protein AWH56_015770 [Anaerobacillus isosaccharinicus]|uniref:UPF0738 protein AWH56_015770 n=1 Tax=Anaerobacillus isosaccharinicus TaxID=1532552 RepID=A0A1S2L773_9BACI|nr:hypothetical protein [Anaerobacillus isosaccharinicus]MBA5587641.1 hypothetical protein [Anaerobacillus isosaccharinicus]QOY34185.1 hypothetical protein AWH56_015770 [Anaerobacillus isosaccharinicus]